MFNINTLIKSAEQRCTFARNADTRPVNRKYTIYILKRNIRTVLHCSNFTIRGISNSQIRISLICSSKYVPKHFFVTNIYYCLIYSFFLSYRPNVMTGNVGKNLLWMICNFSHAIISKKIMLKTYLSSLFCDNMSTTLIKTMLLPFLDGNRFTYVTKYCETKCQMRQ